MANSKVRWGGTTEDGRSVSTIWGNNPFTWGDVSLAVEIAEVIVDDGVGYKRRKERLDDLFKDEEKKQTIFFLTNTNDVVKLSKSNKLTVEIEENTKEPFPYIEVRDRLEALISRNIFYKLVDLAKEEKGRLYIESDSQTFILGET